jgi:hypothetical protein
LEITLKNPPAGSLTIPELPRFSGVGLPSPTAPHYRAKWHDHYPGVDVEEWANGFSLRRFRHRADRRSDEPTDPVFVNMRELTNLAVPGADVDTQQRIEFNQCDRQHRRVGQTCSLRKTDQLGDRLLPLAKLMLNLAAYVFVE